ncbi:MAG: electron transfer complex subunit TmcD [Desulfovibrionales bacterium]
MEKPAEERTGWDWSLGTRHVADLDCRSRNFEWREEYQVSPDGERIGAVIKLEDSSTICVNEEFWELRAENIRQVRFTPQGALCALVMQDDEWTLAIDQELWPSTYAFLWQPLFSHASNSIAAAVQNDLEYGMVQDGRIWPNLYENANHFTFSPGGNATAAVVQTVSFGQADIQTYQKGCFSVARNGIVWDQNFVNVWTPVFNSEGTRVAAQVRPTIHTYSIAVDGQIWPATYSCVWEPCFHPKNGSVLAPVRVGKKWGLAGNGELVWEPRFLQLWQVTPAGGRLYAVVATRFGHWTVAVDDQPWKNDKAEALSDLTISPDGSHAAARAMCERRWTMFVDGVFWNKDFKRIWNPVFSPDSAHVAAKVDLENAFTLALDGRLYKETYDQIWDPVFDPQGEKILVRGIKGNNYLRTIASLDDFS